MEDTLMGKLTANANARPLDEVVAAQRKYGHDGDHRRGNGETSINKEELLPDIDAIGDESKPRQRAQRHEARKCALRVSHRCRQQDGNRRILVERREPREARDAQGEDRERGKCEVFGDVYDGPSKLWLVHEQCQQAADKQSIAAYFGTKTEPLVAVVRPEQESINGADYRSDSGNPSGFLEPSEKQQARPYEIELLFHREGPEMPGGEQMAGRIVAEKEHARGDARQGHHTYMKEKFDHAEKGEVAPRRRHETEESTDIEGAEALTFQKFPGDEESAQDKEQSDSVLPRLRPWTRVATKKCRLSMVNQHQQNGDAAPAIERCNADRRFYLRWGRGRHTAHKDTR